MAVVSHQQNTATFFHTVSHVKQISSCVPIHYRESRYQTIRSVSRILHVIYIIQYKKVISSDNSVVTPVDFLSTLNGYDTESCHFYLNHWTNDFIFEGKERQLAVGVVTVGNVKKDGMIFDVLSIAAIQVPERLNMLHVSHSAKYYGMSLQEMMKSEPVLCTCYVQLSVSCGLTVITYMTRHTTLAFSFW